jgi:hypothetical protein
VEDANDIFMNPADGLRVINELDQLADEELRGDFARKYPEAWNRIQARRSFMADGLGIRLKPEVLPFSSTPAYLPPFLLRPDRAMTVASGRLDRGR